MAVTINASTSSGVITTADNSGVLQLQTNSGQTAMTIDTSQNVGIGTTSPKNNSGYTTLTLNNASNGGVLELTNNNTTIGQIYNDASNVYINSASTKNIQLVASGAAYVSTTTNGTERMRIDSSGNLLTGGLTSSPGQADPNSTAGQIVALNTKRELRWNNTNASIYGGSGGADDNLYYYSGLSHIFRTSGTERMRIDSSGNVLIGATSLPPAASATRFYVVQPAADYSAYFASSSATAANCYGPFIRYTAASPNNASNEFLACVDSSVTRMTVRANGGIANYSANNVNLSDEREKKNIELAGSYLDKICAIPVKTFNYIDQNIKEDDGLTLGVIAQDVQAVAPELVMESDWGTKEEPKERLSIYQTDLQYALMKCIQEQQTIINELKLRIEALEGAK